MSEPDCDDPFRDGLPVVEAARIRLRPFEERDLEEVFRLYEDKEATRYGYSPKMESLEDARALVAETTSLAASRTLFHFGVATRDDDRIIGHATIFQWMKSQRRAELGYSVRKDLWGQGYATEAANALLGFGFERLSLRRVEADVDPRNPSSVRVLEKLGFVREGYLRERWEVNGELQDGVFFGLLRREWRGASPR